MAVIEQLQVRYVVQMVEHQTVVSRLVDQHLHSIQALRELESQFAAEFNDMIREHNEHIHQCSEAERTHDEARLCSW